MAICDVSQRGVCNQESVVLIRRWRVCREHALEIVATVMRYERDNSPPPDYADWKTLRDWGLRGLKNRLKRLKKSQG